MKAVVFDGTLRFSSNYPDPEPAQGEALIKIRLAGICNTDLEIVKGYTKFRGVIGHEFVGIVEEIKGAGRELLDKRVIGEINCGCGLCEYCVTGLQRHCLARTTLGIHGRDGVLAEKTTLPVTNLFVVPTHVKDEEAVFVEPLAAALEVLEQIHLRPTDRVLILGDGKLGILVALAFSLSHAEVLLAGKYDGKLAIVRDQGVATVRLDALAPKKNFDVVVDATGSPMGLEQALRYVKPRGIVVLKTTSASSATMNLSPIVADEVQVVGSRCGPFGPALRVLSDKRVRVGPLISGVYSFARAAEAFSKARERESLKVLIDFSK